MKAKQIFTAGTLVAMTAFLVMGFVSSKEETVPGYQVGDSVDNINLMNVDETMMGFDSFPDAKGFILIFTCNTCPYAIAWEDRVIALDEEFKSQGYPVIAINPNSPAAKPGDSFKAMQQRAKDKGYTFPYLQDKGQKVYPKFGATKTPHVYVLQKEDGKNIVKYIGAIDDNSRDASAVKERYTANAVNQLIKGQEVSVKETRAIGCSIKV